MYNSELLRDCKILAEYSWFVEEVRKNCKTMDTALAVDKAISDMPEDFEIKKFLMEHRAEVKNMSITEYDEAKTIELFQKEARDHRDREKITDMLRRGKTVEEIVDFCSYPYDQVKEIEESLLATVRK